MENADMHQRKRLIVLVGLLVVLLVIGLSGAYLEKAAAQAPDQTSGKSLESSDDLLAQRGIERFRTTDIAAP